MFKYSSCLPFQSSHNYKAWLRARREILQTFALSTKRHQTSTASEPTPLNTKQISAELQSRDLPYIWDSLTLSNSRLLAATLSGFLPSFERPRQIKGRTVPLWPGHHLVYFPPPIDQRDLLTDGTDSLHSPGGAWTQRLWAGGRVRFSGTHPPYLDNQLHALQESITDVRFSGLPGAERIFVKIRRVVAGAAESMRGLRHWRLKKEHLATNSLVTEDRLLCFLRDEPKGGLRSLMRPRAPIPPPLDAYYSHSFVPTPALLFRFSALTFNAHAIHIDPEYTREFYGLPNLLVHGPLSLLFMLECMQRALEQFEIDSGHPRQNIVEIDYKNLLPLFVNEEMTVCCKRENRPAAKNSENANEQGLAEWSVWIEKGRGEQRTVAVRGTVKVGLLVGSEAPAPEPGIDVVEDQQHGADIISSVLAAREEKKQGGENRRKGSARLDSGAAETPLDLTRPDP